MSKNELFVTLVEIVAAEAKKHLSTFIQETAKAVVAKVGGTIETTAKPTKKIAAPEPVEAEEPEASEETQEAEAEEPQEEEAPAPKKPAAKKAEAPAPGTKNRSTDVELVEKFTAQLAEAKAKKAPKEKIAEIQAKLNKYTEKVKAAGKTVARAPKAVEPEAEEPQEAEVAKKPAAKAAKETKPAPKADVWDGKAGIIPVKVGDMVVITNEEEFEMFGGSMKGEVIELSNEGKIKVWPAEQDGSENGSNLKGAVDKSETGSFNPDWVDVLPDGSNIKLLKKPAAFGKK